MRYLICVVAVFLTLFTSAGAQSPNATLNGQVVDSSGGAIAGANVDVVNLATNVRYSKKTNAEGMYLLPELPAANYEIQVSHAGFKTIVKPDVLLNVRDAVVINFTLPLGAVSERVTVEGGAPMINTESAAVSTVVDRQFAENLPMNGRSFQTLIQLTPGVVVTPSNPYDSGQFSVNGQRASSNYWMVDGVSANVGIGVNVFHNVGNGLGGSLGSFSAQGGTNSLVSVDAMQEFRIQTSTYAPEFGRTPGAQISILTRSGTNALHGTAFEFIRNDKLDANNWFANAKGLKKPQERQNDFGGTFSGPIAKDRTFFFLSYEGLRLRLPQVALTSVPDAIARQNAKPALQAFLNAFPMPNGTDNVATGVAQFNASFSNSSTLDAYSLRVDHKLRDKLMLFGRYNYSPSEIVPRGSSSSLSTLNPTRIETQTVTLGTTWLISPLVTNDLRFNYSRTNASDHFLQDNFGGAVPPTSLPLPTPYSTQNAAFYFDIFSLANGLIVQGADGHNLQRQYNVVDTLSVQKGGHSLKFGVDFRRLSPLYDPYSYAQEAFFNDVPSAANGNLSFSGVFANRSATLLFRNLGAFAQDTWRIIPRLTLTYGLRWDIDVAPSSNNGPSLPGVTGFNLSDLSKLALAPGGTPPFKTPYGNLAPRLGVAYQVSQNQNWQAVVRGGFGVFFDLETQEVGSALSSSYPFGGQQFNFGGSFPLDATTAAPPPITAANLSSGTLSAFDPNLKLPYTLQWNVGLEQGLGTSQTISTSYVGAAGRRLIQTAYILSPNPNFGAVQLVTNRATSDFNALQVQFQRRLSRGLQALVSYTWSHSIDTASAGSRIGNAANAAVPTFDANANRGPSDFDIRNAFSAGVTYDIPAPKSNAFANALLRGWSLQNVIQVRSAPPVNLYDSRFSQLSGARTQVRPDLVPGIPIYLYGSQYPGGKIFNNTPNQGGPGCKGPFCDPPTDSKGNPLRQGNLSRNALRGFGASQWDFAVHRDFPIHELVKLQFRTEMFNVLNHPSFGTPVADLRNPQFGQSTQTLGQSLNFFNQGGGGFSPLYQVGGSRSIQFGLKLQF